MQTLKMEPAIEPKLLDKAFLLHNEIVYQLKDINTLGKDHSCSLRFIQKYVDERHCRIYLEDHKIILRDLKSEQGTYLNDVKIIEAELSHGDIIRMGHLELIFSHSPLRPQSKKLKLISKNEIWSEQLKKIYQFAQSEYPVLIAGESGTGKDLIAQQLHEYSQRSHEKLVCINCSALSPQLIESELFGHQKGSFTGAEKDRKGAFVEAKFGTLFLDEIGDLPLNLQPKLLRALENNEIKPVGSDQTIKTNVRIITATHKNLDKMVEKGLFRQDLFFRINVLQLNPPSLKERFEDFNDLFYHFAKLYRIRFDFNSIEYLKKYDWPGNIRELKNFVIKASVHYKGELVNIEKVKYLLDLQNMTVTDKSKAPIEKKFSVLKQQEIETICEALALYNGNQRKAAKSLGMAPSTMCDRVKKYGINIKAMKKHVF